MLAKSPNGRANVGTVSLDAIELKFAADGSLTITSSHAQQGDAVTRANWLACTRRAIRSNRAGLCTDAANSQS